MSAGPLALFRFYASHWRGAGHAMRCLTLARALERHGWACEFITEEESYDFLPVIAGYRRHDPEKFATDPFMHDLLVVDHYDCGYAYEHPLRDFNKVIMAIDDLADRPRDCDIILDQAYGRTADDYAKDVPARCHILTGPAYALLRDEFSEARAQSLARRRTIKKIERIFVNFGGNDQKNITLETLRELVRIGYAGAIDVVFGLTAPHRESVEAFAMTMPNAIDFYTNPGMADLMVKADLAVGAPGVSACERFCMGLPTLLIQTADNQGFTYNALMRDGLALGGTVESLGRPGLIVDFDRDYYLSCVESCAAQADGQGPEKIVTLIHALMEKNHDIRKKVS